MNILPSPDNIGTGQYEYGRSNVLSNEHYRDVVSVSRRFNNEIPDDSSIIHERIETTTGRLEEIREYATAQGAKLPESTITSVAEALQDGRWVFGVLGVQTGYGSYCLWYDSQDPNNTTGAVFRVTDDANSEVVYAKTDNIEQIHIKLVAQLGLILICEPSQVDEKLIDLTLSGLLIDGSVPGQAKRRALAPPTINVIRHQAAPDAALRLEPTVIAEAPLPRQTDVEQDYSPPPQFLQN